jgi:hypothetical protein
MGGKRSAIQRKRKKRRKGRGRTLSLARGSSFSGTRCSSGVCERIISAVWQIREAKGRKRRGKEGEKGKGGTGKRRKSALLVGADRVGKK